MKIALKKKQLLLGIGIIVLIGIIVGAFFVKQKMDEEYLNARIEYFCTPENLAGRWISEDGNASFFVYLTQRETEVANPYNTKYDIRVYAPALVDMGLNDTGIISGSTSNMRAYTHQLEVLTDADNWICAMVLCPVPESLTDDNNTFEAILYHYPDTQGEGLTKIGTYVFHRSDSLIDGSDNISQPVTEEIKASITQTYSNYYNYDAGFEIVSIDFDDPGTTGFDGQGVNFDGYIHGTGVIAPADGNIFRFGTSEIEFYIDPATNPMSIYSLKNITQGQTIVSPENQQIIGEPEVVTSEVSTSEVNTLETNTSEVKVTENEWKEMYRQLLTDPDTFDGMDMVGVIYLRDLDDNEVPELYITSQEGFLC